MRRSGYSRRVLCGAGMASRDDVQKAIELATDGVLVASSLVRAQDCESKLRELAGSLS